MKKVAIILRSCDYESAMSAFMLANASKIQGSDVHIYMIFRGVRIAKKGYKPRYKGFLAPLTGAFEKRIKRQGFDTFAEQLAVAQELGVKLYVCDLCVRIGLLRKEQLIDGVEVIGMPRFAELADASDSQFSF